MLLINALEMLAGVITYSGAAIIAMTLIFLAAARVVRYFGVVDDKTDVGGFKGFLRNFS